MTVVSSPCRIALMGIQSRHVSEREAFATLVKTSQHTNRKLRDVADDVYVKGVDVLS